MDNIKREPVSFRRTAHLVTKVPGFANSHFTNTISRDNVRTTGTNLPDWKERIAEGRSATTTLIGTRWSYHDWPFEYELKGNPGTWLVFGKPATQMSVPSDVNGPLALVAAAQCKQKFARKVRNKTRTWQGGVFAGELREAAVMLASPTKRLRREVDDLLRYALFEQRKWRKVKRLLHKDSGVNAREREKAIKRLVSLKNVLADTWLEWSFGIKPLIQDANDAAMAFRRLAQEEGLDKLTLKAEINMEENSFINEDRNVGLFPGVSTYVKGDDFQLDKCTYMIRGCITAKNPIGGMPIPGIFGMDLSNIAPTAWEIIPWSFFVDYFTDVGSAIDAWSIRLVEFGWTNHTVRNSRKIKLINCRTVGGPTGAGNYARFRVKGPYLASGSLYKVERQPGLPAWETYVPQFRIPGYPSTKWLNIAALMNGITALKRP